MVAVPLGVVERRGRELVATVTEAVTEALVEALSEALPEALLGTADTASLLTVAELLSVAATLALEEAWLERGKIAAANEVPQYATTIGKAVLSSISVVGSVDGSLCRGSSELRVSNSVVFQ